MIYSYTNCFSFILNLPELYQMEALEASVKSRSTSAGSKRAHALVSSLLESIFSEAFSSVFGESGTRLKADLFQK